MKTLGTLLLTGLIALSLGCGYSHSMTPAMAGNTPTIANGGLSPASAAAGNPSVSLTVNGTMFAGNAVVNFNGVKYTPTPPMTSTMLTVSISTMGIASGTVVQVTVTNPGTPPTYNSGGTSPATSNMAPFTVN